MYIPLIDKVLLKDNVPAMLYNDSMKYAETNGVQIATKDELLQMYLYRDEINRVLKEHNGNVLNSWISSSSEYYSYDVWIVNFDSGSCISAYKVNPYVSRAVVDLKQ